MEEDQTAIEYSWWQYLPINRLLALRYYLGVSLRASGMGWGGTAYPDHTYRSLATVNRILSERGLA